MGTISTIRTTNTCISPLWRVSFVKFSRYCLYYYYQIFLVLLISTNLFLVEDSNAGVLAFSDISWFEVKENSPPQTYVGRIATKPGFTYRFNDEPLEFYLDEETGVIVTTDVPTDRENKGLYDFIILSSSPTYPIEIKIRIIDVNDNLPYWPLSINTNLTFSESAPIGTKVILDNAVDLDQGDLQYKIDYFSDLGTNSLFYSSNTELPFKLHYNSSNLFLYLEVTHKLDREVQESYFVNITAYDQDFQSSSSIFRVQILDSNDNPPIFDHSDYNVGLNESMSKDVPILTVRATDADEENHENSRIAYYFDSEDFKIDSITGVISTKHDGPIQCGSVNNEKFNENVDWRVCVFTVFAHDYGVPRQDGRTYVTAKIYDTNNHAPIIKFRYFSKTDFASVDENSQNGSVIAAVSVTDFDQGVNGQTLLEITSGNDLGHFRLESIGNSHIIKINQVLDREKISKYNLTMSARDRGTPSKSSAASLIIMVLDHNDHGPKFDREVYETTIVENQFQTGVFVYTLHATDLDEGVNAQIFYSISGANSHYFKIDSNSGLITTDKLINREIIDFFELRITARDGGSNPKWAHTLLKIKVLDINDEVPSIELLPKYAFNNLTSQFKVQLDEGLFLDLNLIVKDADLGLNGSVDVKLLFDYDGLFKIDQESMKLVSTKKLDYEQCRSYRLVLLGQDRAPKGHQLWSLTTIHVNVKDIDDFLPRLYQQKYYSFIPIQAFGSFNHSVAIKKLQVKDSDSPTPISFVIHSRDDIVKQLFYISNHGEIKFKNNVNVLNVLKSVSKLLTFNIECVGCEPDYNASQMNIFLIDSEVTSFDAHHRVFNFSIEEHSPSGSIVGELNIDSDQYELYLIHGIAKDEFKLQKNQLIVGRGILDRESKANYRLQVVAIRESHFFYIDINIQLLNLNDCDPYFILPFEMISLNDDIPLMSTIYQLYAIDSDLSLEQQKLNSTTQYKLIKNPFNMFIIQDNELKLAKPINNEIMNDFSKKKYRFSNKIGNMINNNDNDNDNNQIIAVKIRAVDSVKKIIPKMQHQQNDYLIESHQRYNNDCHLNNNDELTLLINIRSTFKIKPRFSKRHYEIFISESTAINEQVFQPDILDSSSIDESLSFSIVDGHFDNFAILPSGQIFIKSQLDRERRDIYLLNIILHNSNLGKNLNFSSHQVVDSCQMLIHIKDVNDNKPVFDSPAYRFLVPENVSANFFIGQVQATDLDIEQNSLIVYSIVNSYYSSFVEIDPVGGYLWTTMDYDRESLSYFEIVVQAIDQPIDEMKFTSQVIVRIDILDINDNKPVFEMPSNVTFVFKNDNGIISGEISVSEAITVDSTLVHFKAIDLDNDSKIFYHLNNHQENVFKLNSNTGVLKIAKKIDRELKDSYLLTIEASDGKYANLFDLKVIVEDVNDCQPEWVNFTQNEFLVPENLSIGSEILTLNAVDYDLGANSMFYFAIQNHSENQKYFDILNQKLVVVNKLDYEKHRTHVLNISLIETVSNRVASIKTLKIDLININDCQPTFIQKSETEVIRVIENIDIGSKLLTLQAVDCDTNDVLTYEIVSCNTHYHTHRNIYQKDHELQHRHDTNNCPLKLNTKTGEIININNLDREVIESINLKLSVKDSVGHIDKMKVIFIIDDINDESPIFLSPKKILISNEIKKPNIVLGSVKAIDLDLGVNSAITYKLSSAQYEEFIELDRFSGIFISKRSLEPLLYDNLYVNVTAVDGGGLSTVDTVQFIVKPNKPYLKTLNVRVEINENEPIGTELTKLKCNDEYDQTACQFHLVNATDRNFEVDSFTGSITTVDLIDREMLEKRLLEVLMISKFNLQIIQVHINILDQNDNPLYLTNTSIVVKLNESMPIGSLVFDISQLVADEDTNNKFDFQILNCSNCQGVFQLNRKTGILTLQTRLDSEITNKYKILFGISDGIYLLTSLMDVIVEDENDNVPYFNQTNFVFLIKENTDRGTMVGQVFAFDNDKSSKNLIYSIVTNHQDEYGLQDIFSLNSRNGKFTLSKKLDYETDSKQYKMLVVVSDGKFKSDPVQVFFKLINLPDNPPVFEKSVYKFNVVENKIYLNTFCVVAFDVDLKPNNDEETDDNVVEGNEIFNLTYSLDFSNFKSYQSNIIIDRNNGCISIIKPLDREQVSFIELTAMVSDNFFNATSSINLKVLDQNDNYPIFDKKTPKVLKISENVPIDTVVYTFSATDLDEPPNNYIKYELIDNFTKLPFFLGSIDGQLRVTSLIDRESLPEYYDLAIRAIDYGQKYSDFLFRIIIDDVIDNSPMFDKHFYELKVYENITVGQIIFKLEAQDLDPTDEINYKIISGDKYGHFSIVDDFITIAMSLDFEEKNFFDLKVNAIDKAGNIDTTNIRIIILNIPDEKPIFPRSPYHVNWFENQLGILGRFEAISKEKFLLNTNDYITSHSLTNYLILNNYKDCFRMNSSSAVLSIVKAIDREILLETENEATIELKVMAINSISRLASTSSIYVRIIDFNDNEPKFIEEEYTFKLNENQFYEVNTTVGTVQAYDRDEADILRYSIDSQYDDKFWINSEGKILLQSSLIFDREEQFKYELKVFVSDFKHTAQTNVIILINDVNDCVPKITKLNNIFLNKHSLNNFKLKIPLTKLNLLLEKQFPLIGLQINDCDESLNGQIQVRMENENLYNVFKIDEKTGVIKSDSKHVNMQKNIILQISNIELIITDLSDRNQLSSQYSINLEYPNAESYIEQNLVAKDFIELFLSENTETNATFYKFEISKTISEINIYAGDVYSYFNIVDNGLVLSKALDYESIKSYDLYLQATNHQKDVEEFQYIFVRVNVVNENDNAPVFIQNIYNVTIDEEEEGAFVTKVLANDIDSSSSQIKYKLLNSENLPFRIDSENGQIWTNVKIDREIHSSFTLTVSAEDEDNLSSTAKVIVNIDDKNDNPPRFTRLFRANISESTTIDSFLLQVTSIDKDFGNNSQVTYSLLNENKTFRIEPTTGKIFLVAPLDRETREEYFIQLSANDGSWKSQTAVTIHVLDENDNVPKFQQTEYIFNINLDQVSTNESIGSVSANDQDEGTNGLIMYKLKNRSKYFRIDGKSGQIFFKKIPKLHSSDLFFLNKHLLTVIAYDRGLMPLKSKAEVVIICHSNRDFNNEQKSRTTIIIPENLENNALIYSSNSMIRLIDSKNNESIVRAYQNQLLFNNQSVFETKKTYSILVFDCLQTFSIDIKVINKNHHAPKFIKNDRNNDSLMITEITPPKYLIYEFKAIDDDDDVENNKVQYSFNITKVHWNLNLENYLFWCYKDKYSSLFQKNSSSLEIFDQIPEIAYMKNPFFMDKTNGSLFLLDSVDYEIIVGYSLSIIAQDSAWYQRESVLTFNIGVEDIEDNVEYNLLDSNKLYHSPSKPDPMSIGVMVVIFFFVILILVILTSFFFYHNQKKNFISQRKIIASSLGPYIRNAASFPTSAANNQEIDSRFPHQSYRQQNNHVINSVETNVNKRVQNNHLSNNHSLSNQSSIVSSHHRQISNHLSRQPPTSSPPPVPSNRSSQHNMMRMNSLLESQYLSNALSNQSSNQRQHSRNSPRVMDHSEEIDPSLPSIRNDQNHLPSTNVDPTDGLIISRIQQQRTPTIVSSSIYTQSNSENFDNYSNILAGAEHYDLENASSIAPSDIDIVYHYKGFRNRDSLHQPKSMHAPLTRLSPCVSELSSAPRILTLQDFSPQQIPPPQPPIMSNHHRNHRKNCSMNSIRMNINNVVHVNRHHQHSDDESAVPENNSFNYSEFDENYHHIQQAW